MMLVPEVARALVLPDRVPPSREKLLTLLLCWDSLEVVLLPEVAVVLPTTAEEPFGELVDHGLLDRYIAADAQVVWRYAPDARFESPPANATAEEIARAICDPIGVDDFAHAFGALFANQFEVCVRGARADADRRGLPSVAVSKFSAAAAAFPPEVATAPHSEAALANAAIQGVSVLPGTTTEDVVSFRERNKRLMGRFRAAIIDLADTMQRDAPPPAVLEQAQAILKNRVEPALADLEDVLKRGRIRYAWKMLTGATSVLLGPATPAVMALSGGRITSQALDYAFDRDKLLREHPYGLLHAIRSEFGEHPESQPSGPRRGSLTELEAQYVEALRELVGAEPAFEETLERTRSNALRRRTLSSEEALERSRASEERNWPEVDAEHIDALRIHSYVKALTLALGGQAAASNDQRS